MDMECARLWLPAHCDQVRQRPFCRRRWRFGFSSSDVATCIKHATGTGAGYRSLAFGHGLSLVVGVKFGGINRPASPFIATSPDLANRTSQLRAASHQFADISYGDNRLVAVSF